MSLPTKTIFTTIYNIKRVKKGTIKVFYKPVNTVIDGVPTTIKQITGTVTVFEGIGKKKSKATKTSLKEFKNKLTRKLKEKTPI